MKTILALSGSPPIIFTHVILQRSKQRQISKQMSVLISTAGKHLQPFHTKMSIREEASSHTYSPSDESERSPMESNIFDSMIREDTTYVPVPEVKYLSADVRNRPYILSGFLQRSLWLLGPLVLLITGIVPTLWLSLPSIFQGPNMAGLLALIGLDCIFNIGATLFLLMADTCARSKGSFSSLDSEIPFRYKFWNLITSLLGFLVPLAVLLVRNKGFSQLGLPFISFSVLLGPYLLLLFIQMLTEMLTWHWRSPVWLVTPVVYEIYRVLQLMRGLRLGTEIGAPEWAIESIRVLVSWWVLILGMQLMKIASFAGLVPQMEQKQI